MVPINQYACGVIAAAGRTGEISPAANGENSVQCAGQPNGAPPSPPPSSAPTAPQATSISSAPVPPPSPVQPSPNINVAPPAKAAKQVVNPSQMHLTCARTDDEAAPAAGVSFLLNCTMSS